jgi:hypothetical protein
VKINDLQMAMLAVQLSALGQIDLSDNDHELLARLDFLLTQALLNVRNVLYPPTEEAKES